MKNLKKHVEVSDRDFLKYIGWCTLDMICETTLGYNTDVQNGNNVDYYNAYDRLRKIVGKRFFQVLYYFDFIYKKSKQYLEECKDVQICFNFTNSAIEDKKKEYLKGMSNDCDGRPQILINRLIELFHNGDFTEENVKDEVGTVIAAGHDTGHLTISLILLMLAIHQDIQEKVLQEILTVNPNPDAELTYEDAGKLSYLKMVIKVRKTN